MLSSFERYAVFLVLKWLVSKVKRIKVVKKIQKTHK